MLITRHDGALHRVRRLAGGPVGIVVATTATALLVVGGRSLANPLHVALIAVACAAYLSVITRPGGSPLSIRLVALAIAAQTAVALAVPPSATEDLWWYSIYGRILAVHHASPYTHVAANYPHDPFVHLVGRTWRHTPSVYGPAFTALSATVAFLFGPSQVASRLFYQGLAATALVGACVFVWKRTRSAEAVAFLALNPLTSLYLVNGGRNDILVALSLVAAVFLVTREHPVAGGVVGGLGALVKLTGLVGVVALCVTLVVMRARGPARRFAIAAFGTVAAAYAVAGTAAVLTPMQTAGARYSRLSVWHVLAFASGKLPSTHLALVPIGCFVVWILWRSARSGPETSVPATLSALTLSAPYTLPGYVAWALPTAALRHRSRVSRVVACQSVLLVAAYAVIRHPFTGRIGDALTAVATVGGPFAGIVLLGWLAHSVRSSTKTPQEIPPMSTIPLRRHADLTRALVVVPTLNEHDNVEPLLRAIRTTAPMVDVLIVDDASPDHTADRAEALGHELGQIAVLRRQGEPGLGAAYRDGFRFAIEHGYDAVVEMDADLSHDPATIPALLDGLGRGADLAIGSRYTTGGATPGWPLRRRVLSRGAGLYARLLLHLPSTDPTGGFRAFRTSLLRDCDVATVGANGFAFQLEMLHRVDRLHAAIVEVPIVFRDRSIGESKMSMRIAREALRLVADLRLHPWVPNEQAGRDAPVEAVMPLSA
jgi:dolichol-phosphate mannosyltransferase